MRYAATALLVLGLGITAMAPVAFAQVNVPPNSTFTNQSGNQVVPLTPGATGGTVCYMDGVAYSCTQPAPMTMPTPSGSGSGVAGGSTMSDQQYNPFYGGDRN